KRGSKRNRHTYPPYKFRYPQRSDIHLGHTVVIANVVAKLHKPDLRATARDQLQVLPAYGG
ncbi:MAG: hypothetical protein ACOCZX_04575, partial [Candidatus Bipolaricaulota bacterium]